MQSELIKNRERCKQILAFDGMQYGLCRPSDIDFSMDFQQKLFILGELKGDRAPLTRGQQIHLEGIVKGLVAGGKEAYALLCHHNTPDCEHDVHVAEATVTKVFDGKKWHTLTLKISVDKWITNIHNHYVSLTKKDAA